MSTLRQEISKTLTAGQLANDCLSPDTATSWATKMNTKLSALLSHIRITRLQDAFPEAGSTSSILVQMAGDQSLPSPSHLPFGAGKGLQENYGKTGALLGTGGGGSVWIFQKRKEGRPVAVKKFRRRHTEESRKRYNRFVATEVCIGSALKHCNIIEVVDVIRESGHWFEVMEYAPYSLFAAVKSRKMSLEEIECTFRQVATGTNYLHALGFAHRDLKLENVVITELGIMKIIDFGCATTFGTGSSGHVNLACGKHSRMIPVFQYSYFPQVSSAAYPIWPQKYSTADHMTLKLLMCGRLP